MQKVKEEFFLSVIFVLKWLSLGLGALAIVYFAISLAYQKSYYEPLIQEYDLEISELKKKKIDRKIALKSINITLNEIHAKINILKKIDIPAAKDAIILHEKKIESLNESIIDKYNPFNEKSDNVKQIYAARDKAVEDKEKLDEQLEDLHMMQAVKAEAKSEIIERINQIDIFISVEEHEKERVGTGALGVLPWLLGILGIA